jgi:hypothetical protein
VYAVRQTAFHAPSTNAGDVTITDQQNNVVILLEPGRYQPIPVDAEAVVNTVTGTGDWHRLSQWKAQGAAGDKVHVDAT